MNPKELEEKEATMREKIRLCAEENSLSGEDIAPIYDGIYSAEEYLNSSCRILWVLKEPYDDFDETGKPVGGGWSFADGFEHPLNFAYGKTGSMVTYVSYGLLHNYLWNEIDSVSKNPEVANCVQEIAYINLSKMPAYTTTSYSELWRKLDNWVEIVLEQIRIFEPQVVIFGGTFNYLRQNLIDDSLGIAPEVEGFAKCYDLGNCLYIDTCHPGARLSGADQEKYANSIIESVRKWKAKPKHIVSSIEKYTKIGSIAQFLLDNQMKMTGRTLADLFNTNEIWTSYGSEYVGGRGTYRLIRNAYHFYDDQGDERMAKIIAEAFIMPNGYYAWE